MPLDLERDGAGESSLFLQLKIHRKAGHGGALGKQKQAELCKFESSLVCKMILSLVRNTYYVVSKGKKKTKQKMV